MGVGNFVSDRNVDVSIVSGFNNTPSTYYTGDSTGPQVNMTGFTAWVVRVGSSNESNVYQFLFGKSVSKSSRVGWSFNQFNSTLYFTVGGEFSENSPTAADLNQGINTPLFLSNELNKLQVIHATVVNNVIYLYKNGVRTGPGVTKTDHSFDTSTKGISIGSFPVAVSGDYAPHLTGIVACGVASSTGLTDQQVSDHYSAILANVYATPTGATNLFRAVDAGATWTDTIGGLVATRSGAVATSTLKTPFYYPPYNITQDWGDTRPILPTLPNSVGGLKVLGIGDSFTIGGHISYRWYAQQNKDAYDMSNLTWVGPVQNTDYGYNDAYDAYGGAGATNHLVGDGPVPASAVSVVNTYDPAIVVIWLGNNSVSDADKNDWYNLVVAIHAAKPNIRFISISNFDGGQGGSTFVGRLNLLNNLQKTTTISRLKNLGIKIIGVKIDQTVTWNGSHNGIPDFPPGDGHPTLPVPVETMCGYNIIGEKVFQSLRWITGRE